MGFGISTPEQVGDLWQVADAAAVGSAIVAQIERHAGSRDLVAQITTCCRTLCARRSGRRKDAKPLHGMDRVQTRASHSFWTAVYGTGHPCSPARARSTSDIEIEGHRLWMGRGILALILR